MSITSVLAHPFIRRHSACLPSPCSPPPLPATKRHDDASPFQAPSAPSCPLPPVLKQHPYSRPPSSSSATSCLGPCSPSTHSTATTSTAGTASTIHRLHTRAYLHFIPPARLYVLTLCMWWSCLCLASANHGYSGARVGPYCPCERTYRPPTPSPPSRLRQGHATTVSGVSSAPSSYCGHRIAPACPYHGPTTVHR